VHASEYFAVRYERYRFTRAKPVEDSQTIKLVYLMHDLIKPREEDEVDAQSEPEQH
jgi:hypothetical protein